MYQIRCDDRILFDLREEDLFVTNPKLKLETNKVGELKFKIYPNHPYFDDIKKMKSIIRVYQFKKSINVDGKCIFKGRVIEDKQGFDNAKEIECESKLAMLIDSQTPPFDLTEGTLVADGSTIYSNDPSPKSLFKWLVENHNSQVEEWQQFELDEAEVVKTYTIDGVEYTKSVPKYCTVVDPNDTITRSNNAYATTFNTVSTKFIDLMGGYINVRYDVEKDGKLVDYLEYINDFEDTATQQIEFGENLLDLTQSISGIDIATVLIPLGKAGDNNSQLTIKEVPDGTYNDLGELDENGDIVKSGATIYSKKFVELYGRITKTIDFADVETDFTYMFKKAIGKLKSEAVMLGATIELKAVDLSLINKDIESFNWQDKIKVLSKPHNIHAENNENAGAVYLLEKMEIDLAEPQNADITLGKSWQTITDITLGASREVSSAVEITNNIIADYTTNQQVQGIVDQKIDDLLATEIDEVIEEALTNTSIISQTAEEIVFEVVQSYVEKAAYTEYQEDISTTLQLLADELVLKFNTAISEIETVGGQTEQQFTEISKYIRFVDGKIMLGEVGNQITLEISNDRLSFLQNNLEVAYMSNNKLFVLHSEFIENLQIGNFAFTPRANGSLSLRLSKATTPDVEEDTDTTE